MGDPDPPLRRLTGPALAVGVAAVFVLLVYRDAWLCDDAFITFRVVDNFHHGFGLRWNVVDRVQVFTHPLWLIALLGLGGVIRNLPLASLWFSIVVSTAAFALIVPRRRQEISVILLALFVPASKAVVQFATSGLEAPLAFLLLALLVLACNGLDGRWGGSDRWVPLLVAAVVLTRPDLLLIAAPLAIAWIDRKGIRRAAMPLISGGVALAVWELFSFVYYGSLVPNTALAKLDTGLPFSEKILQGLRYVGDFALRDPGGLIGLALCLVVLIALRTDLQARAVAGGIALYLLYIISIGGDFMSGRFFAVPIFFAVAETLRWPAERSRAFSTTVSSAGAAAVILVVARLLGFNGFVADTVSRNGIADERMVYAPALSLAAIRDGRAITRVSWVEDAKKLGRRGPSVMRAIAVGMAGYYGGPNVHILDVNALGDPLLSRLPARSGSRIGHFERRVPAGYEESLRSRRLVVEDHDLNEFCKVVWSVTRGPVWSASRLGESIRLLFGSYDPLVDAYLSRSGAWLQEPGVPALPPPDATIEMLFLPSTNPDSLAVDAD